MPSQIQARNVVTLGELPAMSPKNKQLFETLIKVCQKKNLSIYTPLDMVGMKLEDKDFFNQIVQAILKCDFLIVDVSSKESDMLVGLGILIGTAHSMHKSIIILARSQTNLSKIMQGLGSVSKIIFYENMEDLAGNLDNYLTYGKFKK